MGMIDAVEIRDKGRFEQRQKRDIEALDGGELLKTSTGDSGASGAARIRPTARV